MAKNASDIFICKLKKDDYWAYPSPFVAHGGGTEIQFRNLTGEPLEIDLRGMPVHRQSLSLSAGGADFVIVDGDAKAGFYPYKADMLVPAAASVAVRKPPARAAAGRARGAAPSRRARPILVRGGSPPRIIIDT